LRLAWAKNSQDLITKITRAKWAGGVAQVVENCFALQVGRLEFKNSNSSPTKKKKKERKKERKETNEGE
jgi:hypothetical protein